MQQALGRSVGKEVRQESNRLREAGRQTGRYARRVCMCCAVHLHQRMVVLRSKEPLSPEVPYHLPTHQRMVVLRAEELASECSELEAGQKGVWASAYKVWASAYKVYSES